jgi:type VI secretion system protein ImpH
MNLLVRALTLRQAQHERFIGKRVLLDNQNLEERLSREYPEFDFFQALALIEEKASATGALHPLDSGNVRFVPDASLSFPANDIASITTHNDDVTFFLSFMGLVGSTSPLPVYFSEHVHRFDETSPGLRDFLTIFNHRIYVLFYHAWKKYHFLRNLTAAADDPFSRCISCLVGNSEGKSSDPSVLRLLTYAGILAGSCRSASGLQSILSHFFGDLPVKLHQWLPRRAELPDLAAIGSRCQLGVNAVCGTTVLDMAGKFRVTVGPLPIDIYETFMPGSKNVAAMKQIIQSFLIDPLEFDMEIQLQSVDLIPVILGEQVAQLGQTTSLGRSDLKAGVQSIIIEE